MLIRSIRSPALVAQGGLAIAALLLMAVWPPAAGAMLLIPLPGTGTGRLVTVTRDGGGSILGAGPFPGSLLIRGERRRLLVPVLRARAVMLTGRLAACGAAPAEVPAA